VPCAARRERERERESGIGKGHRTVQIFGNARASESLSLENCLAHNKPNRLLREIAFFQTEAFHVASPF